MQSPLAGLMGLADDAVGFIQKVLKQTAGKAGFDEQLNTALTGGTKAGKTITTKQLSAKGPIDEETMKAILASPQAMMIFQYLSTLSSFGVGSQDAQALLLGKGAEVSDDALKAILASCGIKEGEIGQIMADQKFVTNLKAKIAESVSSSVQQQAQGSVQDVDFLIKQATADQSTFDATVIQFVANMQGQENPQIAGTMAPAGVMETSSEMRKIIAAYLKSEGGNTRTLVDDSSVSQASAASQEAVTEAVDVLENSFGISRKVLKDLFFSTDPLVRQTALDEATSRINAFLSANGDAQLPKQITDALSVLKSSLSQEEFAPIAKAVDLWSPDLLASGTPFVVSKETFQVLARTLGEEKGTFFDRYTQQVMDQIKQIAPLQLKNGEGSITLQLKPPMLGNVDVNIHMEDGAIQAVFRTDQALTRDVLHQNMHILKEAFAEQGIRVTQVSVSTDLMNSRNSSEAFAWTGSGGRHHGSSGQGSSRDTGGAYRAPEEYEYAPAHGYSESGGLDIFA